MPKTGTLAKARIVDAVAESNAYTPKKGRDIEKGYSIE